MKKNISLLSRSDLESLKKNREVLSFAADFDLVYEKQIPNAGIALLEGNIELVKNKVPMETLTAGCLLGVHHIIHEEPVKLGAKILKNSKIILIGKSEIVESLKESPSSPTSSDTWLFRLLTQDEK